MPEFLLQLKLDDKDFKVKIISDSEDAEKLRKKFETSGIAVGRTINELRARQKNLNELFERSEIGSDEFKRLKAEIDKTNISLAAAEKGVQDINKGGRSLPETFAQWGNIVTGINQGLEVARKLYNIISQPIAVAGQFEQLNVQFEVLLGSQEKAIKLVSDIQTLGASTPLELMDLQKNAKTLLSFGIAGEEVVDILKTLGDISGGDAERLGQLTLAYSQMQSTGRLMGQDLLQMINAGFNPLKIIYEETGKSMGRLKKEMEAGAITSDIVTAAFKKATSEGGQFYGMMDKQAKTYEGMKSNLADAVTMMEQSIGEKILPIAKNIVDGITSVARSLTPVKTNVDKVNESAMKQRLEFEKLVIQYEELRNKANKNNEENEKYNSIINTLQSKYPEMFKNLDLHKDKIEKVRDAFKQTREAIEEAIRAELKMAEAKDVIAQQMEVEKKQSEQEEQLLTNKAKLQAIQKGTIADTFEIIQNPKGRGSTTKRLSEIIKEDITSISGNIEKLKQQNAELEEQKNKILGSEKLPAETTPPKKTGGTDVDPDKIIKQKKEEFELYKTRRELNEISLQDYEDYLKKKLEALKGSGLEEKKLALEITKEIKKTEDDIRYNQAKGGGVTPLDIKAPSSFNIPKSKKEMDDEKKLQDEYDKMRADSIDNQYAREYALLDLWKNEELKKYGDIEGAKATIDQIYFNKKVELKKKELVESNAFAGTLLVGYRSLTDNLLRTDMTGAEKKKAMLDAMQNYVFQLLAKELEEYIIAKTAELLVHTETEAAKTATTEAGTAARILSILKEIAVTLANAAASIVRAAASVIEWEVAAFGPFALLTIPASIAGMVGIYNGIKKLMGFDEGGRLKKGEPGLFEGRRNEIVAPEEDFISVVNDLIASKQIAAAETGNFGIDKAVFDVERKIMSLNYEINSAENNNSILKKFDELGKKFDNVSKQPIWITDDACGKIYERGRKLAGYKT